MPHLIIKKDEAELALKFLERNKRSSFGKKVPDNIIEERERFFIKMKNLKKIEFIFDFKENKKHQSNI